MNMPKTEENTVIKIKKPKSKNNKSFRRKNISDDSFGDDGEEDQIKEKLEEMKTIQKLRDRPRGVSVLTLTLGEKVSRDEEVLISDPFKIKSGGLVNMASLKSGKVKAEDDAYDTGIGTQFSAETNKRDEDDEMMKYIEVELSKRKGKTDDDDNESKNKYCSPEEAALLAVPSHLTISSSLRSEEMLSNQMLSGIPEVDLGIEAKIKNIEATEEAKLKLLWEKHNKKDGPSQFVPTNMAVNFVQHNRFNIEDQGQGNKRPQVHETKLPPVNREVKGTKRNRGGVEKATDDYHFEKFKKQ
ncbi:splicing factor C9orf78 homolog, partial [Halyomorpha halys]